MHIWFLHIAYLYVFIKWAVETVPEFDPATGQLQLRVVEKGVKIEACIPMCAYAYLCIRVYL